MANTTITPNAGTLKVTTAISYIVPAAALALTGYAPGLRLTLQSPSAAFLSLVGQQPVVVAENTGRLNAVGNPPLVGRGLRMPTYTAESMDSDFFQRLNENPLDNGTWFNVVTNGLKILDTAASAGQPGLCISGWKTSEKTFGGWQSSTLWLGALSNFDDPGVAVLCDSTGGGRGYVALYHVSSQQLEIYKLSGGTLSSLTTLSVVLAATDMLTLEAKAGVSSTLLTAYKNGVSIGNVTDSTSPFLNGQPGLAYNYAGTNSSFITGWLAIDLATNSLTLTGYRPFVGPTFYPLVPQLTLTGYAPTINIGTINSVVFSGALALAGVAPTVRVSQSNLTLAGALAFSSDAPILNSKVTIQPGAGGLTVTGVLTGRTSNVFLSPSAGTAALNGAAPFSSPNILTQTGALTLSGQSAGTGIGGTSKSATPFGVDLVLTGVAPIVGQSYTPQTQTGALALSGSAGTVASQVTPAAGAASFNGVAPVLSSNVLIQVATGSLSLLGYGGAFTNEIKPQTGTLALTGRSGLANNKLAIPTGALVVTGQQTGAPQFSFSRTPFAGALQMDIVGKEPTLLTDSPLIPGTGALSVSSDSAQSTPSTVYTPQTGAVAFASDAPTSVGGVTTLEVPAGALVVTENAPQAVIPAPVYPGVTQILILNTE